MAVFVVRTVRVEVIRRKGRNGQGCRRTECHELQVRCRTIGSLASRADAREAAEALFCKSGYKTGRDAE